MAPPTKRLPSLLPLAIFALVLLLRLTVLARISDTSFLLPTGGDMRFYDDWAQRLVHGQSGGNSAYYGLPGYAWLLAAIYRLCGYQPFIVLLLQAAADAGTATLILLISQRTIPLGNNGKAVGLIAACGWAFFVPAQAYAAILMPTALVVFLFWLIVWLVVRFAPSILLSFGIGLIIGFAACGIATISFLVPLVLGAIWLKDGAARSTINRSFASIALLLSVAAGTSPCWIHNYFIARDPVLLSAHSGVNFWIGNNPTANGYPNFPPGLRAGQAAMLQDSIDVAEKAAGHPLPRSEVSHYWSAKAWNYIQTQPGHWLQLLGTKLSNLCNAFQYDDLSVITILREQSILWPGIYFGLVAALGLPGLVIAWRIFPASRWLTAAIALHLAALLPVFTTERYRLPIVPGLLIFSASGLLFFWTKVRQLQLRPVLAYTILIIIAAIFVSWPKSRPELWALDAYNTGRQALELNNFKLAQEKLALAHAYVPSNAETNFALGNLRLAQRDPAAARTFYLATLQLDSRHHGASNNLGVLALKENRSDLAAEFFKRALSHSPGDAKIYYLLAQAHLQSGDRESARRDIAQAIQTQPAQPEFRALQEEIR